MLRMKTRSFCELIIVARSPSSAPSPTTLGSCERIAIRAFGVALEQAQDELVDQRRLARAARAGEADDAGFA